MEDGVKAGLTGAGTGALTGVATGAALGSAVPVVGTAIGAAVGAGIGGLVGAISAVKRTKEQKELERLAEQQAKVDQDTAMRMSKIGSAQQGPSSVIPAPNDVVMAAAPNPSSFDSWLKGTM